MRSIGKVKIRKLKKIIAEEYNVKDLYLERRPFSVIRASILDRLPLEWWDTWECADSEIRRVIEDEINRLTYRRA